MKAKVDQSRRLGGDCGYVATERCTNRNVAEGRDFLQPIGDVGRPDRA
jgi:hypothetical protein